MAKKSIGAVLTLKDGNFRANMRQSIAGFDKFNEFSKRASKGAGNFERSVQSAGSKAKTFAKDLAGGALALAGVGSAAGLIGKAFNEGADLEGYRVTLDTAMKDTKKAAETMKWAVQFANETPFDTGPVIEATAKLQAYGISAKQVLPSVGNMAAGMNKDIMQAVEAVADAQTGELERLKEFGVTKQMIVDQGAKIMRGKQIVNNKGEITDQTAFNKALFSLMDERFAGGMSRQAKTFNGIKSTITGTMSVAMARMAGIAKDGTVKAGSAFDLLKTKAEELGSRLTEMQKDGTLDKWGNQASSAIRSLVSGLRFTKDLIIATSPLIAAYSAAWAAHRAIIIATTIAQRAHTIATTFSTGWLAIQCAAIEYQTVVAGGGSKALGLITAAQWLWNVAMTANPIGLIIIGVAALAAGIIWLYKNFEKVTGAIKRAWGWLTKWKKDKKDTNVSGSGVKGNAIGTSYWRGGLTWVGEQGPELANLPPGTQINSHSQSMSMTRNQPSVVINVNGSGLSAQEVAGVIVPEIKLALANM